MLFLYFRRCFARHPILTPLAVAAIALSFFLWAIPKVLALLFAGAVVSLIWVFVLEPFCVKIGVVKKRA